jgi:hypothetical protein
MTDSRSDKEREADPFFQPFDCHYDGVWNICDKQGCHDEEQCKRRTSGPKNAAPQESVRGATPARPAVAAPSPYSLGYNELAERVVELERELAEARTIEQELGAIIRKQNDAIAVSHVAQGSHLIADKATDAQKARAYEWLRSVALGKETKEERDSREGLAALALDEWHRLTSVTESATGESEAAGLLREAIPMVAGTNHEKAIDLERRIVDFLSATERTISQEKS